MDVMFNTAREVIHHHIKTRPSAWRYLEYGDWVMRYKAKPEQKPRNIASTPILPLCCIYGKKKSPASLKPHNIIRQPGGREKLTSIYKSFMRHGLPISHEQFEVMAYRPSNEYHPNGVTVPTESSCGDGI
jgi:hypothetical protein